MVALVCCPLSMARLSEPVAGSEVLRIGSLETDVIASPYLGSFHSTNIKNERSCYFAALYVTWVICVAFRENFLSQMRENP
jgi:hypothetical protein